MQFDFGLYLLPVLLSFCIFANAQQKTCTGGFKEGDQVDRGRYWYTCQDGQLVPKGCFSDNKQRLNLQESFESGGFVLSCVIDANGYLSFAYKGCSYEGKQYAAGETWQDDKYWYSCTKENELLRMDVGGCIHENKRYNIADQLEKGEFVYECRRWANQTCSMCPVACINDGKHFKVGESFEKDKFWYMCTTEDKRLIKKCVGCMHASQRLLDGDRYRQNDAVFECNVRKDSEPKHTIVGCVDQNGGNAIERRVGCQWTRGVAPLQYVMKCDQKDDTTVIMETVHCYYAVRDGGWEIDPGCFKVDEDKVIACRKTDAGPQLETFPASQLEQAYSKGVRFC
jgi:hypothetical protein